MLRRLEREARLFLVQDSDPEVRAREDAYRALLTTAERRRHDRFRVERGRREFLAGRALARHALSRCADVEPAAWRLRAEPKGRLEIDGPAGVPDLRFNLSHSGGLVACLVTLGLPGGVDVERLARRIDLAGLAERYFSPAERRAVLAAEGGARRHAFYSVWTLKEAYLKARGMGIALPLRELSFEIGGGRIRARFGPSIDDDPSAWQLDLFAAGPGHLLATALRLDGRPGRAIVARRAVPLGPDADAPEVRAIATSRGG